MQRTHVEMVDDLDGQPGDDVTTHTFTVDGVSYAIDLSEKNGLLFAEAFEDFVSSARLIGGKQRTVARKTATSQPSDKDLAKQARAWARANGLDVNTRGRVPAWIVEQYQQAA